MLSLDVAREEAEELGISGRYFFRRGDPQRFNLLQLTRVKSWPSLGWWASLGCITRSDFNPFNALEAIDTTPNEVWMKPYVFVFFMALKPPQVELASLLKMFMCRHVKVNVRITIMDKFQELGPFGEDTR